mmetsp:Transcript_5375/g.9015  ORF Transcript_5375/g.9015 Transcript_5375/m.9015 type:complete len:217 (-) Transcript_5375:262-912(-)
MSLYPQVPQGAGAHQPLHDEEDPSTNDPMPMHPVVQAQPVAVEAIAVDVQNDPPFAQAVAGGPSGVPLVDDDMAEGKKRWGTGFCDCFSQCAPSCLMSWICPCFTIARIRASTGIREPNFCGIESKFWPNCCFYALPAWLDLLSRLFSFLPVIAFLCSMASYIMGIFNCCLLWGTRKRFRDKYNIKTPTRPCCMEDGHQPAEPPCGCEGLPDCCAV